MTYDVLDNSAGTVLSSNVSAEQAAAWMTDHAAIDLGDARIALAVVEPGDVIRCGKVCVRVKAA